MPSARNGTERQTGAVEVPAEMRNRWAENRSLKDREIDFDLVEPAGVDRGMDEDWAICHVSDWRPFEPLSLIKSGRVR
jgi:hypothetical protein